MSTAPSLSAGRRRCLIASLCGYGAVREAHPAAPGGSGPLYVPCCIRISVTYLSMVSQESLPGVTWRARVIVCEDEPISKQGISECDRAVGMGVTVGIG